MAPLDAGARSCGFVLGETEVLQIDCLRGLLDEGRDTSDGVSSSQPTPTPAVI